MQKKDVLIVSGGHLDKELLRCVLARRQYYIIAADRGADYLLDIGVVPDLAVGDFDSADNGVREALRQKTRLKEYNPRKDYTDTHIAVSEALLLCPDHIVILGATGGRIDHLLGNIELLYACRKQGVEAVILDENNKIRVIDNQLKIKKEMQYGRYISCIPFTESVKGLTITGFEYNLEAESIYKGQTIGISNELREEEGCITVRQGCLIVMETKD